MAPRLSSGQVPSLAAALDALTLSSPTAQRAAAASSCRVFSTTQRREKTSRGRRDMYTWLASRRGRDLEQPSFRGPQYIGGSADQPFPQNPLFRSEPVLDEESREAIWQRAMEKGHALKEIAYDVGADVRRIAAIVRLKQVEKNMVEDVSCSFALRFCSTFSTGLLFPLGSNLLSHEETGLHDDITF